MLFLVKWTVAAVEAASQKEQSMANFDSDRSNDLERKRDSDTTTLRTET